MSDSEMIAEAFLDKNFTGWVERYFGFSMAEIPMNNAVLQAVAVAWIESRNIKAKDGE
ncbi:hypothetical protein [Rahnella sikkimica]|uniref:hypothetical protein n=1 Tax=Rahnella sikkimica TaxID=1805933 RepID=UPI0018659E9A|nr:hypothetical protein [Rahnella sikkimica]